MLARGLVFVAANENVRMAVREGRGRERDSKVLDAYGRDVLNENCKGLLSLAGGKK